MQSVTEAELLAELKRDYGDEFDFIRNQKPIPKVRLTAAIRQAKLAADAEKYWKKHSGLGLIDADFGFDTDTSNFGLAVVKRDATGVSVIDNRTDISGTASEMIYKHAIVVVSSIAEGLLAAAAKQLDYAEGKFPKRLKHLLTDEIITQKLHDELTWMWDVRQAVHVHIVNDLEWEKYKVTDARRASKAVKELEEALDLHFSIPPF